MTQNYIIDLVDSIEYTTTNCFTHQLHKTLHEFEGIQTVALANIQAHPRPDLIISRLKQRTLYRVAHELKSWAQDTPVVIFDQDPWEAFRDDSPFKGAYERINSNLNVKKFVVTSAWWRDFLNARGYVAEFGPMWLLPEYCTNEPQQMQRPYEHAFYGTLHTYRQSFFDTIKADGFPIHHRGGLSYGSYLTALSETKVFVYSDEFDFTVNGVPTNLKNGLWGKVIEAAGRGCFVVRNKGDDWQSYLDNIESIRLFDDPSEVSGILNTIRKMDPIERQTTIDTSVAFIKQSNRWQETAKILTA